jgi:very-short-patch-repair endonuclease
MIARDPSRSPIRRSLAQKLRSDETDAEHVLWQQLRGSRLGKKFRRQHRIDRLGEKFRRQHRIDRYIVDFYCVKRSLAIELDGGQHYTDEDREKDARRTEVLARYGVRVARFSNIEALTETRAVVEEIRRLLEG